MDISRRFDELHDRFSEGDLSRRGFLKSVGVMAASCGIVASGLSAMISPARAAGAIRFDGFGGFSQAAFDKYVLQPFAKDYGAVVNQGSYSHPDQFLAQIQADGVSKYNVFWAAQELSPIKLVRRGWVEQLDETKIPRLGDLQKSALEANRKQGGGKLVSVPYSLGGGAIAYNTKLVTAQEMEEKGFKSLIDPGRKGMISGFDNWQYRIWYAALQDGQDPNNIQDLDAIWAKIGESKKSALKYYTSSAEQVALITSGEIAVADGWFVPIHNLRKRGESIGYWPLKGSYVQSGSLVALKGTPMDLFYEMADVLLRPEVMFPLSVETGNLPLLDPAKHPFPADVASIPGYLPPGSDKPYYRFDPVYWDEKSDAWSKQYQRVLSRS